MVLPETSKGENQMASKIDREREAIQQAEAELEERKKRLQEMEREETERELHKLVRKVGIEQSIALLGMAVSMKPKRAIEVLETAAGEAEPKAAAKPGAKVGQPELLQAT